MAELKIDLIVDNKGSIQIQKFGLDAERAFSRSTSQSNSLRSSIDRTSSSFSGFGSAAKSAFAIFSTYEILQFIKSIGETVVKLDSLERAFAAISGSQQGAAQEMSFLRDTANRTGQDFYKLAQGYQQLTASTKDSNLEGQKTRDVFSAVSEAAAVLGLSQERVDLSIRAIGQMASKGVVQMEELKNQLGDHIPGAVQIAARALGVTTQELYDMSKSGDLLAEDVLPAIASELHRMYGEAAQTAALSSGQSAVNKLSEAWTDFKANLIDSQTVIDTIWGIAKALKGLSSMMNADMKIDVGMPGMSSDTLNNLTVKEMQLKRVAYLEKEITASEQERERIQGNVSGLGYSAAQTAAMEKLNTVIVAHRAELTQLNKAVNNQSPYVTGEAAGKLDITAQAFGHLGFQMQGVRVESEKERKASAEAHKETQKYIETKEQALKKAHDTAMAGARTDAERLAVNKKYEEELAELQERGSKGASKAAKDAARGAEQRQKEYQAIIDRLLPLEAAQREYNESLVALDAMDPTKSTERYQTALANLNEELQRVRDSESGLAESRAAAESAISAQQSRLGSKVAYGQLTETEALPFEIDLLKQRLQLQQAALADLQGSGPAFAEAYNSQIEKIEEANRALAEKERLLRLRDGWEGAKQALSDYSDMASNMGEQVGNVVTNTFQSMEDAMVDFVTKGKVDFASLVDSIIADLARIAVQQSVTGPIASALGGVLGAAFGSASAGSTVSSNFTASAVYANAKGNVFSAPGLSAYSNSIVSSPTFFAKGGNVMGEAGPEAIIPLKRDSSGNLGVSGGGANVTINIIESSEKGGQQQQRNENGQNIIDVFVDRIKSAVAGDISSGSGAVPNALQSVYGLNRASGGY